MSNYVRREHKEHLFLDAWTRRSVTSDMWQLRKTLLIHYRGRGEKRREEGRGWREGGKGTPCVSLNFFQNNLWALLRRLIYYRWDWFKRKVCDCTVEVDGDVDDTRVLIVSDEYLMISSVLDTRRLNRRRDRTVAPVHASATRKHDKRCFTYSAVLTLYCCSSKLCYCNKPGSASASHLTPNWTRC